jgi:exopolyphosphatase/guanosine-5'-triphosphate,3'-diphosphate pyrophosphatase
VTNRSRRAVIDIGSNTIRLVVYGGPLRAPHLLYDDKLMAGLGRGVVTSGRLDKDSTTAALAGLGRFAALLRLVQPDELRVVATAAVRDAANGAEFLEAVRALGLPAELLSGEDEARASAWGVIAAHPGALGLVADLGGGSLELARVAEELVHECASFPFGTMRVAAIRAGGRGKLRKALEQALSPHGWLGEARGQTLYLVGGAWRALGKVQAQLSGKGEAAPFTPAEARRLKTRVRILGPDGLAQFKGVSNARAAQLGDASALLAALVGEVTPGQVVVSATGLREGLLVQSAQQFST